MPRVFGFSGCEGSGGDVGQPQVQRAEVHEGCVRPRLYPGRCGRGSTDAGWQRHAATGHVCVTLHWAVLQLRTELGEKPLTYQWSPWCKLGPSLCTWFIMMNWVLKDYKNHSSDMCFIIRSMFSEVPFLTCLCTALFLQYLYVVYFTYISLLRHHFFCV